MAGQYTRLAKTYRIAASNVNENGKNEIPVYRGVTLAGAGEVKLPSADNQVPLGVTVLDERLDDPLRAGGSQAGRQIGVQLDGIPMIELAETVAAGDRIYLGQYGKGKKVPTTPNATPVKYEVLGFAEKGGNAGDVVPVRFAYHVYEI